MVVGYLNTDDINGLQGRLAVFYLEISLLDTSLPLSLLDITYIDIDTMSLCQDCEGCSPLHLSARERRSHCVRLLVKRGASLEVKYFLLIHHDKT